MRSQRDLTGLIKFLARDDWKSRFEEVMGEHLGPAMRAFDLEYEEIGEVLGGGWDMTLCCTTDSWAKAHGIATRIDWNWQTVAAAITRRETDVATIIYKGESRSLVGQSVKFRGSLRI